MTQADRELFELGFGLYQVWRLKLVNSNNRTRDLTAEQAAIHNKTAIQFSFDILNWPIGPCSNSSTPTIEVFQVGESHSVYEITAEPDITRYQLRSAIMSSFNSSMELPSLIRVI